MLKFDDSFGVRSLIELFLVIGELKISIIISSIDESLTKGCVSSLWMFCLLASRNVGLLYFMLLGGVRFHQIDQRRLGDDDLI